VARTTFLAHAGENTGSTAAASALAVWTAEAVNVHGPLPTAAWAAAYAGIYALSTRIVKNNTASMNPNVVAARRPRPRRKRVSL
jgi:hypothetical protein